MGSRARPPHANEGVGAPVQTPPLSCPALCRASCLVGHGVLSTWSWPGLSRPSTSCFLCNYPKTWMPGTRPGMTTLCGPRFKHWSFRGAASGCEPGIQQHVRRLPMDFGSGAARRPGMTTGDAVHPATGSLRRRCGRRIRPQDRFCSRRFRHGSRWMNRRRRTPRSVCPFPA